MYKAPGEQAVGDVGRLNAISVGADHRDLEWDKCVRERIEVAARTAPRIRHVGFCPFVRAVASSGLRLAIVRGSRILQGQQSIRSRRWQYRIHHEKIVRVCLVVAYAKGNILAYGSFGLNVPSE